MTIRASDLAGGNDLVAFINQAPAGFDFRSDFDGMPVDFTAVQDTENAGTSHMVQLGGFQTILNHGGSDTEESITLQGDNNARLYFEKSDVIKFVNNDVITPNGEKGVGHTIEVIGESLLETGKKVPGAPQNFKFLSLRTIIDTDNDLIANPDGTTKTDYHSTAVTKMTAVISTGDDFMVVQKNGQSEYDQHGYVQQPYPTPNPNTPSDNPYATNDSSWHNLDHTLQQGFTAHLVLDNGDVWYGIKG